MALASRAKTVAAAAARSLSPCLATPRRHAPSGFVLERSLDLVTPPLRLQEEWAIVRCDTRNAYGCGEHGQKVLQGLTVHARLVAATSPDDGDDGDITSSLYIEADDDALRAIKAELGCDCDVKGGPRTLTDEYHWFDASAYVQKTDERFVFLLLSFGLANDGVAGHGKREYYLIYDSVAASLLMIPRLPKESQCHVDFTVSPLHEPLVGGGGYEFLLLTSRPAPITPEQVERYTLLLLASKPLPPAERLERRMEDVLCVCRPAPEAVEEEEDEEGTPWHMLRRRFPPEQMFPNRFAANAMFFLGGEAFWVDLRQGLVHCDWPPSAVEVVDFGFIPLPLGCPPDLRYTQPRLQDSDFAAATIDRTSAHVNGTIRFVYIDRAHRPGGNAIVSVSELDLETKVWKNYRTFLAKELWRLWSFKKEGLPETEPRFPVLMAGGTLCLLVCNKPKKGYAEPTDEDYICNVELSNLTVLWSARLREHHTVYAPAVLPTHFFRALNALDPQKRELRGIFTQKP